MNYTIELVRFVAVLMITFTHTRHGYETGWQHWLLERLPLYGTLILSIISGFLFRLLSIYRKDWFAKKMRSLLVPYLIANASVLLATLVLHYLGYDLLERLQYDWRLLTEGLLSLNGPPVNPPTYFIRDIFVVFMLVAIVQLRKLWLLVPVLLLALFGELLLRYDILLLFMLGVAFAQLKRRWHWRVTALSMVLTLAAYFWAPFAFRHFLSASLFLLLVHLPVRFPRVGGFTYLLHLYHSPVIVVMAVIFSQTLLHPMLYIGLQLVSSFVLIGLLFWLTRRFPALRVLSGQR